MNRPKVTDKMIREAIMKVAPKVAERDATEADILGIADSIQRVYSYPMDGFELAKELDKLECWDTTREEADEFDSIDADVRRAIDAAEKAWFEANPVEPPLPIGTKTTRGVITDIYKYQPARYLIKEPGVGDEGRRLIVKFEDAREAA